MLTILRWARTSIVCWLCFPRSTWRISWRALSCHSVWMLRSIQAQARRRFVLSEPTITIEQNSSNICGSDMLFEESIKPSQSSSGFGLSLEFLLLIISFKCFSASSLSHLLLRLNFVGRNLDTDRVDQPSVSSGGNRHRKVSFLKWSVWFMFTYLQPGM